MKIDISYLEIKKVIFFTPLFKKLIKQLIAEEDRKTGNLNIILTSNKIILQINQAYLNHHYFTDVLTFPDNKRNLLSGDIYISVDQVHSNAIVYRASFEDEIIRVIIHGILHLVGYNDKTQEQINVMRDKEDAYLCKFRKYDLIAKSETQL